MNLNSLLSPNTIDSLKSNNQYYRFYNINLFPYEFISPPNINTNNISGISLLKLSSNNQRFHASFIDDDHSFFILTLDDDSKIKRFVIHFPNDFNSIQELFDFLKFSFNKILIFSQ